MFHLDVVSAEECCKRKQVLIYCLGLCDKKDKNSVDSPSIDWGACERYRDDITRCQLS